MSFAGGIFFTNVGRVLQAKAQTGVQLNFTRIGVGDGELGGQDISELTNLIHQTMSLTLSRFMVLTNGKASVGGVMSNDGLATGFYWREIGLFATDPDLGEILYCYGNAAALAEYIPAGGGSEILEKQVAIVSIIGNAANVSATIDQSLLWASQADLLVLQNDLDAHLADDVNHVPYAAASGAANTYAVTLSPAPTAYVDGMAVAVKINVNSTGASTLNVNSLGAKTILDSLGNAITSGGLKAGIIYTLRYNATTGNFIVQGKGGGGNAAAGDLLSGKTATVDTGQITGSMPENGATGGTITTNGGTCIIPAGHTNGGMVTASLTNFSAANIKAGVALGGTAGTFTNDANATAGQILNGQTAYVNGSKLTGSMPNNGAPTLNPGQSISAGYYSGGSVANYPHSTATYSTPGSFTFTVPSNVTEIFYIVQGAGGGGAASGSGTYDYCSGGAAGGCGIGTMSVTPGQQISGTVGTGGANKSVTGGNYSVGNSGGNSTFGTITAGGGGGGQLSFASNGGTCTGATINMVGQRGDRDSMAINTGGNSVLGSGGQNGWNGNGTDGGIGAGGGAAYNGSGCSSGAGGNGQVYIWW